MTLVAGVRKAKIWLATRTRPDISAVLGICASMMVRTPKVVAAHLVDLWRFVWTTRPYAMSTLSPEKGLVVDCLSDLQGSSHVSEMTLQIRQDGQSRGMEMDSPKRPDFQIHSFTDASFSTSEGRSKSGFLICLVEWSSRRQTITAYSAPEAEIVGMSEAVMTSLLTYDAAEFLG